MRAISFILIFIQCAYSRPPIEAERYEALSGVRSTKKVQVVNERQDGDFIYSDGRKPSKFLIDNFLYIPAGASVLDVGMQAGHNAVFLARKGFKVLGIEEEKDLIEKARRRAKEFGVRIDTMNTKIDDYVANNNSFDAIICLGAIDPKLIKKMVQWLRPGGLLFYEVGEEASIGGIEKVIKLFKGLKILKYEAPIRLNDFRSGSIMLKSAE